MHISIDLRSDIPIYIQIVEQVRQQLNNGVLQPGDQLPTVRTMASELRINFNTVSRAYRLLDEAGIISTQQGRGTYILEIPPPETTRIMKIEALVELTQRYLKQVEKLGYSTDDAIKQIHKQTGNNEIKEEQKQERQNDYQNR